MRLCVHLCLHACMHNRILLHVTLLAWLRHSHTCMQVGSSHTVACMHMRMRICACVHEASKCCTKSGIYQLCRPCEGLCIRTMSSHESMQHVHFAHRGICDGLAHVEDANTDNTETPRKTSVVWPKNKASHDCTWLQHTHAPVVACSMRLILSGSTLHFDCAISNTDQQ